MTRVSRYEGARPVLRDISKRDSGARINKRG